MVKHGGGLWARHPHVQNNLTFGERAADRLKGTFGSWGFLIALNGFIVVWIFVNSLLDKPFDVFPFVLLNLGLSWLAAQQGGALQIAANRGDHVAAEIALHTQKNTDSAVASSAKLIEMNELQLEMLAEIKALRTSVESATAQQEQGAE